MKEKAVQDTYPGVAAGRIPDSSGRTPMEMDYTMTITQPDRKNAVVSWTGGKDGCFSCLKAMSGGLRITHLLHFTNVKKRGSHELNPGIIRAQSEAMGIPLVQKDFSS